MAKLTTSRRPLIPPQVLTFALLVMLALPALQPLMRGQLLWTADGTLHLYRLISLDHALADGSLWTRYAAGMAYGYGAPMFNYYSPLSLYPLLALHNLGLSFLAAWLWGMMLITLVAVFGAYLLGKAWSNDLGGVLAAAAYLYAPYSLFDLLWRGTVAEWASLALLPYVLWGLTRLAQMQHWRFWLMTVIAFALFIPMHNVITLHGGALIGLYALFVMFSSPNPIDVKRKGKIHLAPTDDPAHNENQSLWSRRRVSLQVISALGIGALLAAFFWLPAITETRYIKLDAITATLPFIDVVGNLTHLGAVFALPKQADPSQMQPPISIALSWVQIIIVSFACLVAWRKFTPTIKALVVFCLVLIAVLMFMNTPASALIWQSIPLIRYSQYPWRLLGLASLLLALMTGVSLSVVLDTTKSPENSTTIRLVGTRSILPFRNMMTRYGIALVSLLAIIIYSIPYLYPPYRVDVNPQTIVDAQNFEREQGFVATSSFGEYLPIWNYESPDINRLTPKFAQTPIISRLEPPPEVTVQSERWGNTWGELELTATSDTTLTFDWFYFPGWYATLNGQPLELTPSDRIGLINATIPAGSHQLTITLGNTERQSLAWGLSIVGVFALVIGTLWMHRRSVGTPIDAPLHIPPLSGRLRFALLAAVLGLIAVKVLVIDRIDTPLKRTRFNDGVENAVQYVTNANFGNRITMPGYDLSSATLASGDSLTFALYWQLIGRETLNTDYTTVLTLRNNDGLAYTQQLDWQPGGLATHHWQPNYYLQQRVAFANPSDTPPGSYTLELSLYDPQTSTSLDLINADGNPQGVELALTPITITRPETQSPISLDSIPENERISQIITPELALVSLSGWSEGLNVTVGQEITLDWRWQANTQSTTTPQIRLLWMQNDKLHAETQIESPITGFPVDQWQSGEIWRGLHRVIVPGSLTTGDYTLTLAVDAAQITLPAMLHVTAPERTYDLLDVEYPADVAWDNGIRLIGYDIADDGTLMLYWQTGDLLTENLSVFVHVVDANGTILSQSAGVPVSFTRPTTGWDVNEVIADTVSVKYPLGDDSLKVYVGWFNPRTGARVNLSQGDDFWTMPKP